MRVNSKQKSRFSKKDAKTISRFLQQNFPDGLLTAKEVLELAKPKNSPIHRYFTWDDGVAAAKYRLIQARKMISCVVVEIEDHKVRKYVSPVVISMDSKESKKFCEISLARRTPDIWSQVLSQAMRDAHAWRQRYLSYKELSLVHRAIETTHKKLKKQGVSEYV